jgi:hypothetical protein
VAGGGANPAAGVCPVGSEGRTVHCGAPKPLHPPRAGDAQRHNLRVSPQGVLRLGEQYFKCAARVAYTRVHKTGRLESSTLHEAYLSYRSTPVCAAAAASNGP